MLERLKRVRTVDIYGHVTCMRAQRNYMVQTEDQYVFIHDAVLEAIQSGNTEIPARALYAHVSRMSERPADSVTAATGIQLEYRVRLHALSRRSESICSDGRPWRNNGRQKVQHPDRQGRSPSPWPHALW